MPKKKRKILAKKRQIWAAKMTKNDKVKYWLQQIFEIASKPPLHDIWF